MTCQWEKLTGVECKKEATRTIPTTTIPVCQDHYDEYQKDKGQK